METASLWRTTSRHPGSFGIFGFGSWSMEIRAMGPGVDRCETAPNHKISCPASNRSWGKDCQVPMEKEPSLECHQFAFKT